MTGSSPKRNAFSPRYQIIRPLGEGGVGAVYVAMDRESGEQVALKTLTRINPVSVLRFKREFRALANIHHRNLVQLYELEHADEGWFLTMELVEGQELLRGLSRHQTPPSSAPHAHILDAFSQLAQGIHAIHQAGMLHRDLKPSNVMLERQGRVVVLDFGLVRELQPTILLTLEGMTAGTPAYMPPEQAAAEELSEASDWYAFGVMLYEVLSGRLPIRGRTPIELLQRKLQLEPEALVAESIPQRLRELCAGLLRREPRERPGAAEIFEALEPGTQPRSRTVEPTSIVAEPQTAQSSADLFGRDAERQLLESALQTCIREHSTVAVHVRGPSGAGKTALVQGFLADSATLMPGVSGEPLVLRSRCYERESMPFKSIDGVVDALATHLVSLDDFLVAHLLPADVTPLTVLFPVFERVPAVRRVMATGRHRAHGDAQQLRKRAEEGFRYLLQGIAGTHPVVLWIDDLQWGDLDSTQVLQDWLKHPIESPVLLVLTYRSDEVATNATLSTLLAPTAKREQLTRQIELELQPLRDTDVYALCSRPSRDSLPLAPPIVAQIVRDAQGNPFLATQLAALARAKLKRGETDLSALSIKALVQHTSALLPAPAQQLLCVLAVAGRPLVPRIALEAADIARSRRGYVHELQSLRLVRTRYVAGAALLEIYHDGVRESVYASLTQAQRQTIQSALLRALLREGQPDAAWLHELALGAGDRDRALQYGVRAAEMASVNLAFERAAELYQRCLKLAQNEQQAVDLWKQLAAVLAHCGRGKQAADAYLKASDNAADGERVLLLQLAASHLLRSGRFDEGERLVQRVLAELNVQVPTSEAGLYAAIGWERARIAILERVVTPRDGVVIPEADLRLGLLYGNLALDTQSHMPLRATLFQTRAMRMSFQYGESRTTARAYCMYAALAALSAGASASARVRGMLARAEALFDREAHPQNLFELYAARATSAVFLGEMSQVLEPARAAEELYTNKGADVDLGDYFYMFVVRSAYVSALQSLGRHTEAGREVRRLLEEAKAKSNRAAVLQITLGRTAVEQVERGCRDSRARLDQEWGELPASTGVLHMLHLLAVIRAACLTGEHAWALARYAELAPRLEASPLRHSAFLMYLLRQYHARLVLNDHVVSGRSADPERLVRDDLRWLTRKSPLPFRKPAALRIRARLALLGGQREAAAELLTSSRCALEELGAADDAQRDRYALGSLIGGAEGSQLKATAVAALRGMGVLEPQRDVLAHFPELARGS